MSDSANKQTNIGKTLPPPACGGSKDEQLLSTVKVTSGPANDRRTPKSSYSATDAMATDIRPHKVAGEART